MQSTGLRKRCQNQPKAEEVAVQAVVALAPEAEKVVPAVTPEAERDLAAEEAAQEVEVIPETVEAEARPEEAAVAAVRNPAVVHLAEAEQVEVAQDPAEMNPETVEMPEEAEVRLHLDIRHTP